MKKCVLAWLISIPVFLLPSANIAAFPSSCDDEDMGNWSTADCDFCSNQVDAIRCDLQESESDPVAHVWAYSHDGDFVIFGKQDSTLFCCDSGDLTFDRIIIDTDDDDDLVCLQRYDAGCVPGEDLSETDCGFLSGDEDWDDTAWVRTRDGADTVYGSDHEDGCGHDETYWCDDIEVGTGSGSSDEAYGGAGGDRIGGYGIVRMKAYGDAGEDAIRGTSGNDIIEGGAGADQIRGLGGDDTIWAGDGANWVNGGDGLDSIYGGVNDDILCGNWDDDTETDVIVAYGQDVEDICASDPEDSMTGCDGNEQYECEAANW